MPLTTAGGKHLRRHVQNDLEISCLPFALALSGKKVLAYWMWQMLRLRKIIWHIRIQESRVKI